MLMANTICMVSPLNKCIKTYDLKGSWKNRYVHAGENQTMKDRNLLSCKKSRQMKNRKGLLQFRKVDIKNIRLIIESDAKFLQQLKLIDYSLLLAVEKLNDIPKNFKPSRHTFLSNCGRYAYHIAVIDYLTEWNLIKQIESFWKISI